jgi:hypothetical protein
VELEGPRRGSRDNGLRCGNYVAIADLDPRLVDALLETLRAEGIAAYAEPTPASTGGYMEQRLPSRPIDRLFVDDQKVERAKELVNHETGESLETERDFDDAWKQVLVSLQSTSTSDPVPPWPVSEDVDAASTDASASPVDDSSYDEDDEDDDEHFIPPPAPPVPKLRPATLAAVLAIAFGLFLLATDFDGGSFRIIAILAVIGGGASLVWNMRQGPPTDSGWDDGAVV